MSEEKVVKLGAAKHKEVKEKHSHHEENHEDDLVYCSFCQIAVQYLILNDRMPSAEAQQILDAFWGKARR